MEPAFELIEAIEGLDLNVGEIVPASRMEECSAEVEAPFVRAKVGGSDAFIVTAALKLPFSRGSILSKFPYNSYNLRNRRRDEFLVAVAGPISNAVDRKSVV